MKTIKFDQIIKSDNIIIKGLKKFKGKTVEIIILINDIESDSKKWPADFFDKTYGFMKNDKISRSGQGNYPVRDELI